MRRAAVITVTAVSLLPLLQIVTVAQGLRGEAVEHTVTVDGITRKCLVFVPKGFEKPLPVVLVFNGGGSNARQMVAAMMGAQARLVIRKEHHEEFQAQKESAEKKKKTTITAESFDKQVAHKMGKFFDDVFLPNLKKLVEAERISDLR